MEGFEQESYRICKYINNLYNLYIDNSGFSAHSDYWAVAKKKLEDGMETLLKFRGKMMAACLGVKGNAE